MPTKTKLLSLMTCNQDLGYQPNLELSLVGGISKDKTAINCYPVSDPNTQNIKKLYQKYLISGKKKLYHVGML